jgi:hypothetical protein
MGISGRIKASAGISSFRGNIAWPANKNAEKPCAVMAFRQYKNLWCKRYVNFFCGAI